MLRCLGADEALVASTVFKTVRVRLVADGWVRFPDVPAKFSFLFPTGIREGTRMPDNQKELLDSCSRLGIRRLYTDLSLFQDELPSRLAQLKREFTAVGIGLSALAQSFSQLDFNSAPLLRLNREVRFTFCTVALKSEAGRYRETEVSTGGSKKPLEDIIIRGAFEDLKALKDDLDSQDDKPFVELRILDKFVPKAAMYRLDGEVIFYAPYVTSTRTPRLFVIETHLGDFLFDNLNNEIDRLLTD